MAGKEGGEYSVLLNGISVVCLTAKVKTPYHQRLGEPERKRERQRQRESWNLSADREVRES